MPRRKPTGRKNTLPKTQRRMAVVEQRAPAVYELLAVGLTHIEIAEKLGLTRHQVAHVISQTREMWREQRIQSWDDEVKTQLARLERVEAEAWRGWNESWKPRVKTVDEVSDCNGDGKTKTTNKVEKAQSVGDPNFLAAIHRVIESRIKLLALAEGSRIMAKKREQAKDGQLSGPKPVLVVVKNPEEANRILGYDEFSRNVVEADSVDEVEG